MVIDTLPIFSRTFPFVKFDTLPIMEDEIYNEMSGWPDGLMDKKIWKSGNRMNDFPFQKYKNAVLDWRDI